MAGIRSPQEDAESAQTRVAVATDLISDDDRSITADSWSVKSDVGTWDDEGRTIDTLSIAGTFPTASEYCSDKEEPETEVENSVLGLQSYWDSTYSNELTNFREHGNAGQVWFGIETMETIAAWIKNICMNFPLAELNESDETVPMSNAAGEISNILSCWNVLDLGTGNGLFLHELAKHGFPNLTGIDYSEGAIVLARSVAERDGFPHIQFVVNDILQTKLNKRFQLVTDKGALDAISLHPIGPANRISYWESVANLVAPGGTTGIVSPYLNPWICSMPFDTYQAVQSTKDELVQEAENFRPKLKRAAVAAARGTGPMPPLLRYLDHVISYPTFTFGSLEGSEVATVAFVRRFET